MDHQTDEILYVCRAVIRGDAEKASVRRVANRLILQLEEDEKELTGERKVERLAEAVPACDCDCIACQVLR